jgi:hypothetical protein
MRPRFCQSYTHESWRPGKLFEIDAPGPDTYRLPPRRAVRPDAGVSRNARPLLTASDFTHGLRRDQPAATIVPAAAAAAHRRFACETDAAPDP